jgi:hypothetical protein
VLLTPGALNDIYIIVGECDTEVGWLGTVERHDSTYLIKNVILPKQTVSSAEADISDEGIQDIANRLLNRKDGIDILNSIRLWGHSHVNMGTSPSWQDEQQMGLFETNGCEYFIRAIANKTGRIEFTLYLFKLGIKINDIPWSIYVPMNERRKRYWRAQMDKFVEERVWRWTPPYNKGALYRLPHDKRGEHVKRAASNFEQNFGNPDDELSEQDIMDNDGAGINSNFHQGD